MRGFENSVRLFRFIMRRERVMSLVWLVIIVGLVILIPPALVEMYPTAADAAEMAATLNNPAVIAMMGPVYGAEDFTYGAMNTVMMLLWMVITVAIMNIFLVARHTRQDEEKGRYEVLRTLPVGRLSNIHAAMLAAAAVNVAIAVFTALGLTVLGIESMDFAGSVVYGLALGSAGFFFAGLTALFAQLCSNSRGTIGFPLALLGVFYIMRAVGDVSYSALSYVSPLGIILKTQAYIENNLWPIFAILLLTLAITVAAYKLNSVRDIDQGFFPSRPGRERAKESLCSVAGLARRLLKNTIIAWFFAMVILGAAYGSIMGDLEGFLSSNEMLMQMLPPKAGFSITELFITMITAVLSLICIIPVCMSVLKLRTEEKEGRAEPLLSRVVSRKHYMLSYWAVAVFVSVVLPFVTAFGLWGAGASVMEDAIPLTSVLKSFGVYLPAIWVMLGVTVLLIGVLPRFSGLIWAYFGFSFFVIYFGELVKGMPRWVNKLTPFGHIPRLPVDKINYPTLLALAAVAAGLTAVGFAGYSRRDVN